MSKKEKDLYEMLHTMYVVVKGYQQMPGETLHPMTISTLENAKVILEKYK
jgi:hypothetical protein